MNIYQLGARVLAVQPLPTHAASVKPAPVNHVIVIDISGSMYSDLPTLRFQLKNKLATLVQDNDTVSIIWFSGRGSYGILVEGLPIRSVKDLSSLHASIDRYLQPQGLTGFKEPLQSVIEVLGRLKSNGNANSMFFMTDGYDNQWSERDNLAVCAKLAPLLDNAVIVEYGWNCNRPLLTEMAAVLGGKLIFSKDLQSYESEFETEISRGLKGKRISVKLAGVTASGSDYAYLLSNGSIVTVVPDADRVVHVPEGTEAIAYFSKGSGLTYDPVKGAAHDELIWASMVAAAQRMDTAAVFDVLSVLGDVNLVNIFTNCFSKEDYNLFQAFALGAAVNKKNRFVMGYDPAAVPKEDAYSVLHLLQDLTSDETCLFYPYHSSFRYERIGAASEQRSDSVRFEPADRKAGYPLQDMVWNDGRPNVSVRVRIPGFAVLPSLRPASLPPKVDSFIYRNYTIVRDGIVHTRALPLSMGEALFNKLQSEGLLQGQKWEEGKVYELSFPNLPVINRQMVKGVTAEDTFSLVLKLSVLKGTQKVFNELRNRLAPKQSSVYLALYGQEATDWLAEQGVTNFNGYNPPSDTVKTGDVYMAKELKLSAKGLSSLPKVSDVEAALKAGKKLKVSEAVMAPAVQRIQEFMASSIYAKAADKDSLLATWAEGEAKAAIAETRELMGELAKRKFAIVVGHSWFTDLPSLEDNSKEVSLPGVGKVVVTATLANVEVEK